MISRNFQLFLRFYTGTRTVRTVLTDWAIKNEFDNGTVKKGCRKYF